MIRQTHTYVRLELSAPAWNEIHDKLKAAGYDHAFSPDKMEDGRPVIVIDMHGIAVVSADPDPRPTWAKLPGQ